MIGTSNKAGYSSSHFMIDIYGEDMSVLPSEARAAIDIFIPYKISYHDRSSIKAALNNEGEQLFEYRICKRDRVNKRDLIKHFEIVIK